MEIPPAAAAASTVVSLIPRSQNDVALLALRVTQTWADHPEFTLRWITQADAQQQAQDLADALGVRDDLDDDRSPAVAEKRRLEKQMDAHLKYVKGYIDEHWEDDEPETHFGKFGIENTSAGWRLPTDQETRVKSLKKLIAALTESGLADRKFGVAFWQPLLDAYAPLVQAGTDSAQAISAAVGDKNPLLDDVRTFLSRFSCLLEAQCRTHDEYLALRRQMGFLKEYN